jgi:hypothetical protein
VIMSDDDDETVLVVPNSTSFSAFNANFSMYEVRVVLGNVRVVLNGDKPPGDRVVVDWFETLHMSPQTAKQLGKLLFAVVAAYEENFGMIPVESEISEVQSVDVTSLRRYN